MRIFQLLSTIAYGDAVSNDTVAMEKAIKQMGYQTRIYAESIVPPLDKKTALAISELKDVSNDDIIIFHMSTGSRLNFDVAKYPCRKIVVYHNITPPEYFKNNDLAPLRPYSHISLNLSSLFLKYSGGVML